MPKLRSWIKPGLLLSAFAVLVVLAGTLAGRPAWFSRESHKADADREFVEHLAREIQGVDRDHDGVRDDVESWIAGRFPQDSREGRALLRLAADYQSALVPAGDLRQSRHDLVRLAESLGCVRQVVQAADEEIARLKAVILDTDLRVRVWLKTYERLQKTELPVTASGCRFAL